MIFKRPKPLSADVACEMLLPVWKRLTDSVEQSNDFFYSGWKNQNEALQEMHRIETLLQEGEFPRDAVSFLLAPTGSLQEVSVSNGWGEEFLELSKEVEKHL